MPEGDVLALVGDLFPISDHTPRGQAAWLKQQLTPYLQEHNFEAILIVAGNHDFLFATYEAVWRRLLPANAHYLEDTSIRLRGVLFHGTPWTPIFYDWPFTLDEDGLAAKWALIPRDTDVLLSHGPPYGACDLAKGLPPRHAGSRTLRYWVETSQPPVVVCGHIHEAHGRETVGNTLVANVSLLDEHYRPAFRPQTFALTPRAAV
jgi:Icc-related predicted phosphoesterase